MPRSRMFVLNARVPSVKEFTVLAGQAAKLKKHGRVVLNVSSLSGKDFGIVPEGGSAWHEYASYGVALHKFYPHPKIAPFVDAKFVAANRRLLRGCMRVVRARKLEACFIMHEPHFLPEAFFEAYPHLRGPRMDHPRRTRREEFAMCLDHPEGREIFSYMAAQLAKDVPEPAMIHAVANDAGSGFCWGEYLYPGPNGPDHCRGLSVGERMASFVGALREGVGRDDLPVGISGNFTGNERRIGAQHLDENVYWGRSSRSISASSMIDNPVLGVIDPVGMVRSLQRLRDPAVSMVAMNFVTNYRRYHELFDVIDMVVDIVDAFCRKPADGLLGGLKFVRGLCAKWVGEKDADRLLEAFVALREALQIKHATLPRFRSNYAGVSLRLINRPLVAMPDRLSPEEEAYFLPYVFNPDLNEARMDYRDLHGGRLHATGADETGPNPSIGQVDAFRGRLGGVADTLASLGGRSKEAGILRRMALSLRIYGSVMRSIHNFYRVQVVRDRNAEKLAGEPVVHPKVGSNTGDPDLLLLHEYMRDELDNTAELVDILENGGLAQVQLAPTPELEDTFLLGPDLLDQLRRKMAIMRRHWLDASAYMAPPHR